MYNLLLSKRLTTIFYLVPFLTQQAANENFAKLKEINLAYTNESFYEEL